MQKTVEKFNKKLNKMPAHSRILDIQSELGELAKEYLKASNYGEGQFVVSEDFKMELGDVLYSLVSLASETGLDAKELLKNVINKYEKRLKKSNSIGSDGK